MVLLMFEGSVAEALAAEALIFSARLTSALPERNVCLEDL